MSVHFLPTMEFAKLGLKKAIYFCDLKGQGQGIMVLEFLLPFERLNLLSLSKNKQQEIRQRIGLTVTEVVELFEYGKNNRGYWDRASTTL